MEMRDKMVIEIAAYGKPGVGLREGRGWKKDGIVMKEGRCKGAVDELRQVAGIGESGANVYGFIHFDST
jgi:hypothetical protein